MNQSKEDMMTATATALAHLSESLWGSSAQPVAAIDPRGCGCTECLTGLYVPLENATKDQLAYAILGLMRNHTDLSKDDLATEMRNR
jgi:hypothetical protein